MPHGQIISGAVFFCYCATVFSTQMAQMPQIFAVFYFSRSEKKICVNLRNLVLNLRQKKYICVNILPARVFFYCFATVFSTQMAQMPRIFAVFIFREAKKYLRKSASKITSASNNSEKFCAEFPVYHQNLIINRFPYPLLSNNLSTALREPAIIV